MGSSKSLVGYALGLALFFLGLVVVSYTTFAHLLFVSGTSVASGVVQFVLLCFVLPLVGFAAGAALAQRFILRFHKGDVWSLYFAILLGQFLATATGLVFSEVASTLLPLTARGVKIAGTFGTAMHAGVLLGALGGAKQVWTACKKGDAL